jgi:hypothetical protein
LQAHRAADLADRQGQGSRPVGDIRLEVEIVEDAVDKATEPDTSVAVVRVWAMGWKIRDCSVVTATTVRSYSLS